MEPNKRRRKRNRYMTGEDIDMLRERNRDNKKENTPICDRHIDGA